MKTSFETHCQAKSKYNTKHAIMIQVNEMLNMIAEIENQADELIDDAEQFSFTYEKATNILELTFNLSLFLRRLTYGD